MKATIIIPNINGKGWLKDSIESVYAQTEQDFDLIVVDNGSTDESLEQARSYCSRPNFQLIENGSNTGFSHAVNQGIARAKSEFVVLFNNDAFAEPQWLAELIRVAESDEKIFAVQSLMIRHFDRELADDAGDYVTWMGFACKTGDGRRASRYTKQKRIFSACGGAALWLNGEKLTEVTPYHHNEPVPTPLTLPLQKGRNKLLVFFDNYAERDATIILRLRWKGEGTAPEQVIPVGEADAARLAEAEHLMRSLSFHRNHFTAGPVLLDYDGADIAESYHLAFVGGTEENVKGGVLFRREADTLPHASQISLGDCKTFPLAFLLLQVTTEVEGIRLTRPISVEIHTESVLPPRPAHRGRAQAPGTGAAGPLGASRTRTAHWQS